MFRIVLFTLLLFVWCGVPVHAYEVLQHTTEVPYDVFLIESKPPTQQLFIGELQDFPEMYKIDSSEPFLLTVQIRALPNDGMSSPKLNGIIVRQKDGSVEEVVRLNSTDITWGKGRDYLTGLLYLVGETFSQEVSAGVYHIEVSAPQNIGKYILVVGSQPLAVGYFTSLGAVSKMYLFYGTSRIFMLRSPIVYYPVGIIILLGLIGITWRWQHGRKIYA